MSARRAFLLVSVFGMALAASAAVASPFTMTYCVGPVSDGQYPYRFTLTLDNHDGTWFAGQGIGWIVFGDSPTAPSPLAGFTPDFSTFPVGPWTGVGVTSPTHNGPNLSPLQSPDGSRLPVYWVPQQVGQSLTWSGRAPGNVAAGQMRWSALFGQLRPTIQFEPALLVPCPPACGTADFNGDGDVGTDQDIEAFFRCLAGTCCASCYPLGADFNADGDSGTDQDIESFFRVLAGGHC